MQALPAQETLISAFTYAFYNEIRKLHRMVLSKRFIFFSRFFSFPFFFPSIVDSLSPWGIGLLRVRPRVSYITRMPSISLMLLPNFLQTFTKLKQKYFRNL